MGYTKTIVCLANSWKPGGRCVAGREQTPDGLGAWIRPVSDRASREISDYERRVERGGFTDVLDVVEIEFIRPIPLRHQSENHLIDRSQAWKRSHRITWTEVSSMVEALASPLWLNGFSSYHGSNDRIPENFLVNYNNSLMLIKPKGLRIRVQDETRYERPNEREVRAIFSAGGYTYQLAVTDPDVKAEFLGMPDGLYNVDSAALCVSLTEAFHGFAYKLVATIFTPDRR